jgi:hypothetical protein
MSNDESENEQAVIVWFDGERFLDEAYGDCGLDSLEDKLSEALTEKRLGEFDGNEIGSGVVTLFMYGASAEKMFSAIEGVLRQCPLCKGARVIIRCGGPGAEEREVRL